MGRSSGQVVHGEAAGVRLAASVAADAPGRRRGRSAPGALLLIPLLTACGGGSVPSAEVPWSPNLQELLESAPIGAGADSGHVDALLSYSMGARLLRGGEGIVVADRVHPLLRLFHRSGTLLDTGLPRGQGPEEAGDVYGIAVQDDNRILVLASRGFREFQAEGGHLHFLRYHPRSPDFPMPFSVAAGCEGAWYAYVTPPAMPSPGKVTLLARGTLDRDVGRLLWAPWREGAAEPGNLGWGGRLHHVHFDGSAVVLHHRHHRDEPLLRFPCDTSLEVEALRATRVPVTEREAVADGHFVSLQLVYPRVQYGGFALLSGALLEVEVLQEQEGVGVWPLVSSTYVSVTEPTGRRAVRIPGRWEVHDHRDGELLVFSVNPEPLYRIVDAGAVVQILREEGRAMDRIVIPGRSN